MNFLSRILTAYSVIEAVRSARRWTPLERAVYAHTQALRDLQSELRRQREFAVAAQRVSSYQAWKALADILSGQIVGRNLPPRGL